MSDLRQAVPEAGVERQALFGRLPESTMVRRASSGDEAPQEEGKVMSKAITDTDRKLLAAFKKLETWRVSHPDGGATLYLYGAARVGSDEPYQCEVYSGPELTSEAEEFGHTAAAAITAALKAAKEFP